MSFIHHLFLFSSWGPVLNLVFPLILFVFFVVDFSLLLAPRRKKMSDLRLGPAFFSFFFPLRYAAGQDLRDVNGIFFDFAYFYLHILYISFHISFNIEFILMISGFTIDLTFLCIILSYFPGFDPKVQETKVFGSYCQFLSWFHGRGLPIQI